MTDSAAPRDELLKLALNHAKAAMIGRSPAIGLLAADSRFWRRIQEKLLEGYESGIVDVGELTDYARSALPNLRKLHRR